MIKEFTDTEWSINGRFSFNPDTRIDIIKNARKLLTSVPGCHEAIPSKAVSTANVVITAI
jgi:hypothetical protein